MLAISPAAAAATLLLIAMPLRYGVSYGMTLRDMRWLATADIDCGYTYRALRYLFTLPLMPLLPLLRCCRHMMMLLRAYCRQLPPAAAVLLITPYYATALITTRCLYATCCHAMPHMPISPAMLMPLRCCLTLMPLIFIDVAAAILIFSQRRHDISPCHYAYAMLRCRRYAVDDY